MSRTLPDTSVSGLEMTCVNVQQHYRVASLEPREVPEPIMDIEVPGVSLPDLGTFWKTYTTSSLGKACAGL